VSPSGVTCKILSSTWSGNLISNSLNLRQASFNVEARSLFPYSVYEKEGEAHRLDAQMSHSSSWGSNLSLRTPRRRCDTITFLRFMQASFCSDVAASFSEGIHLILLANARKMAGENFWSSFYRCPDPHKGTTSSGRCSPVDVSSSRCSPIDVSSEFGGKTGPVFNIGRVDWDIIRYLFFYLLSIRYWEIVRHIAAKNGRYLKYQPINCPISAINHLKYRPIWNNLFIALLRANVYYFLLSLHAYYIIFIR